MNPSRHAEQLALSRPELSELLLQILPSPDPLIGPLRVDRQPSKKRSSFALEEIDIEWDDGSCLQLVYKDLSLSSLSEPARRAKPLFLYNPLREIELYRSILGHHDHGTPIYYGAVADGAIEKYGLLLERVHGRELYEVGEIAIWQEAARWLAGHHGRFVGDIERLPAVLLRYDADYYRLWPRRAVEFASFSQESYAPSRLLRLEHLVDHYDSVIEHLLTLPLTLLHGEFYASNILVQQAEDEWRVCPVDWEMAAVGPGLVDLAALVAGKWTEEEKKHLASAYHAARTGGVVGATAEVDRFLIDLSYCRLHLAMQQLGWSAHWSPPPEQAHDWQAEAFDLAEKLGL